MTKFLSRIEIEIDGDVVRAKLFDRENVEEIAMCRKTAIRAAMQLLDQLAPDEEGAEVIPMLKRVAG